MLKTNDNPSNSLNAKDIIGCIGKLPVQAEFLRCNIKNQNLKLLEQWLQEGFVHTSRDQLIRNQGCYDIGLNHGLLLNYGIGRRPIVGCLRDSQDSAGRCYPLLVFQELENETVLNFRHHLPLVYQASYQAFYSTMLQSWQGSTKQQFIDQLQNFRYLLPNLTVSAVEHQMKSLYSAIEYQTMWQQVMGLKSIRHAPNIIAGLSDVLKLANSQGAWQINLPISKSQPVHLSICFWLSIVDALRDLNYRNMHLAWNLAPQNNAMNLTIYHGNLSIAFFRSLLDKSDARIQQLEINEDNHAANIADYTFDPTKTLQEVIDEIRSLNKQEQANDS